jgi:hypothetical protein
MDTPEITKKLIEVERAIEEAVRRLQELLELLKR